MSSAPRLLPSSLNCTPVTPTLSDALAETVTEEPETVALLLGAVSETVGGLLSFRWLPDAEVLAARALNAAAKVNVIKPVMAVSVRFIGRSAWRESLFLRIRVRLISLSEVVPHGCPISSYKQAPTSRVLRRGQY